MIMMLVISIVSLSAGALGPVQERPTMGDPELRKRVQQEVERLTGHLAMWGTLD